MNSVEIAYLTIKALRGMPTEEIRQVQLEVNALLEPKRSMLKNIGDC